MTSPNPTAAGVTTSDPQAPETTTDSEAQLALSDDKTEITQIATDTSTIVAVDSSTSLETKAEQNVSDNSEKTHNKKKKKKKSHRDLIASKKKEENYKRRERRKRKKREQRMLLGVASSSEQGPANDAEKKANDSLLKSLLRRRSWQWTDWGQQVYKGQSAADRYLVFKVATYNILAQSLLQDHMHLYRKTPSRYLYWRYRKENLLAEIEKYSPEILCLQEIDADHFNDDFLPALNKIGYNGVYKQKSGLKDDGCAIFFKTSHFLLGPVVPLDYFRQGVSALDRDNVGLLLRLIPVWQGQPLDTCLVVATTHLLFNPRRGDVKLAQLMLLLAELDKLSYKCEVDRVVQYYPVILCGDFNSVPCSPLYSLLVHGSLTIEGVSRRAVSGQEDGPPGVFLSAPIIPAAVGITDTCQYIWELGQRQVKLTTDQDIADFTNGLSGLLGGNVVFQPFKFVSAYTHGRHSPDWQDHEVTTCHMADVMNVDYIFYHNSDLAAAGTLNITRRLKLPTHREQRQHRLFLPNKYVSSDHLMLVAEFTLSF